LAGDQLAENGARHTFVDKCQTEENVKRNGIRARIDEKTKNETQTIVHCRNWNATAIGYTYIPTSEVDPVLTFKKHCRNNVSLHKLGPIL
jgi:hypothetical protein